MKPTGHIQGDVRLRIVKRPTSLTAAPEGAEVLALGETSGHGHVLEGCDVFIGADEQKYVIPRNGAKARLLHKHLTSDRPADHRPIMLGQDDTMLGTDECYQVVLQNRYNPFARLFERVID